MLAALLLTQTVLPGEPTQVQGTIVAIRGGILVIRPTLRPVLTRVAVVGRTEVVVQTPAGIGDLRPGMRVAAFGRREEGRRIALWFAEGAVTPLGELRERLEGAQDLGGGWVRIGGRLKSREPFVLVDDAGTELTADTDRVRGVRVLSRGSREALLIGTRVNVQGRRAPDGVIEADSVTPDRNYAAQGTMFGTLLARTATTLTLRPRYTEERLTVRLVAGGRIQREVRLDPDRVRVGETVAVWGLPPPDRPQARELLGIALLRGPGRYPKGAGKVVVGQIASLSPQVTLRTKEGTYRVVVPAQLIVARLEPATRADLRPGGEAMVVLRPRRGGGFEATEVVLNASPWVGFGG